MARSGLREKTYAYTRQAEEERTQSTPGSYLLLEVQTVKPLELLDEGLTLQIDLSSAFLDYKLLFLPSCPHAPWYE